MKLMKLPAFLLLSLIFMGSMFSLFAQAPKGFSYQAVARDNGGGLLTNTSVNLRFQIRQGSPSGTIVYQEAHVPSTNNYGLLQTIIGRGIQEVGDFHTLDWGSDDLYLVVELNGAGIDTSLFEAVPYAKVATAMSLGQLQDVSTAPPTPNQVLKWDGTAWIGSTDTDVDSTNELQRLSLNNNSLTLSDGNTVNLPTYTAGDGIDIVGNIVSNSAPDQVVSLTGAGGTSITGTYPDFTVTSTDEVEDADASTTNEIQSLTLSGNSLSLSLGGGAVNLVNFVSPWSKVGNSLTYTLGNVGIGDASPTSTLTVGNGDKFQVRGSDGDVIFTDDQASIRFPSSFGANAPMIYMFSGGTNNSTRMLVAHSSGFSNWGLQYNDTADAFSFLGNNEPRMTINLANNRVGIGTKSPEAALHIVEESNISTPHLKLTETETDFARLSFDNTSFSSKWDIAGLAENTPGSARLNFYYSTTGNIMAIRGDGTVGINDDFPAYPLEVNGKGAFRILNIYNTGRTTSGTAIHYGVRSTLSQVTTTGNVTLYNLYGRSTDPDAYNSIGAYGSSSSASNFNYGVYGVAPTANGYAVFAAGNTFTTGAYSSSDAKLKKDILPLDQGLSTILRLNPKKYQFDQAQYGFMNLPEGEQYGFLAHEIETVLPTLVKQSFHLYDPADENKPEGEGLAFKAVNYPAVVPILVAGMQEQQEIIDVQAANIQKLEARLAAIEALLNQK